jgi:maltooligosyltrehalose trehalohydrolase
MISSLATRTPVGADISGDSTCFRVWAPAHQSVAVVLRTSSQRLELTSEPQGYFSGKMEGVGAGVQYKFSLDGGEAYPDPASRYQPDGPHGWSEVIDPAAFAWTDRGWGGVELKGQVIYELQSDDDMRGRYLRH